MVQNCIHILLCLLLIGCVSAASAQPAKEGGEVLRELHASIERTSVTYHLSTIPSPNRKKVDAMCLRYLGILPKAVLIPKNEERTVYRLIAGTFDTVSEAKKRRNELAGRIDSPFVINDGGKYSVVVASHLTEALAGMEQVQLAARGIDAAVKTQRINLKLWQMKSIESFKLRDAVDLTGKMAVVGVTTLLEPANH